MQDAYNFGTAGPISEMAIVDTFTRLIFDDEEELSSRQELIIQAFRMVDASVALDTHQEMGQYLRALGVREMIRLVTQVQACLGDGLQALARVGKTSVLDRRAH